jgi:hypothetical protein
MDQPLIKKLLPHFIAMVLLTALSFVFFAPVAFEGKVLQQGDNQKASAAQTELLHYQKTTGKEPLWTNSMFSGMPAVQIHQTVEGNLTRPIFNALLLNKGVTSPVAGILLNLLGMYILLIVMGIDWRLSVIGAIGYGLSSFNMDITEAGHSTKLVALGYAPILIAGAVLAYRERYWLGGGLFAFGTALQVYANHYQVTYYTLLILMILGMIECYHAIKEKKFKPFLIPTLFLAGGLILGVGSNTSTIWTTMEYQSETIRGTSELKAKIGKGDGLDKKYAFDWKYGLGETITLLVQNAAGGGASQTHAGTNLYEAVYPQIAQQLSKQKLTAQQIEKQADQQISSLFYTGNQPFVGVSIYWGAVFIFAFISGLFLIKSRYKWWIAVSTLLMIMIAWGDNFFFADFMFDYFPMFNKFRAVTQALGMGQLMCILLAMMTLQAWLDPTIAREEKMKALYYGAGITGLFCLIGMAGSVDGNRDASLGQPELINMLRADRSSLMKADGFRSLMLVLLTAGMIWAYLKNKVSKTWTVIAGIGILTLLDTWTIAKRILHENKFEEPKVFTDEQQPTEVDKQIMADKDPHFRVLDLRQGLPFTNAQTSAYHKSVGGYHPAKLMRYQELVEKYLGDFKQNVAVQNMPNMPMYGMLNTKYIIMQGQNGKDELVPNAFVMGNAWFVKNIKVADNGDAELNELSQVNLKETAVIQKSYLGNLQGFTPQYDSSNNIKLTSYNPDKMAYEYSAKTEQVVVFSETYYPEAKGWGLFLGNQRIPLTKANYTLRAAKLPAGQNQKLEMRFEPKSYYQGETMSRFTSIALLLMFLGGLFQHFRQNGLSEAETLPENPPIPDEPEPVRVKPPMPTPTKSSTGKKK